MTLDDVLKQLERLQAEYLEDHEDWATESVGTTDPVLKRMYSYFATDAEKNVAVVQAALDFLWRHPRTAYIKALEAENAQLRAKVAEQENALTAARRNGDRTHRQLMDALAHPEDYTKLRARLLAREAMVAPSPWRGMLNPGATPAGEPFFFGTFKTQDEYATAQGHNNFTITTNPNLPENVVLMVNHPVQARAELVCARCGGWHPYMQQVIAIKDGVLGRAEWVGCNGPKAPTDSNQGEGDTP